MDVGTIRIIKVSSPDREGLLAARIKELESHGFKVLFDEIPANDPWTWTAGSLLDRSKALNNALLESESDAVMWARGGYGASDLLDFIPWDAIKKAKPKPVIGFSDVCAMQAALYSKTGRLSIHGPMPATVTWKKSGASDIDQLVAVLKGKASQGAIKVQSVLGAEDGVSGVLFGGCLSVLTALIGTPYLPKSLKGHLLYFEDIGENPGRVVRMLNQWHQSGLLHGVPGMVLGVFKDLGGELPDSAPILLEEIARRYKIPTFASPDFGHISPNQPLVMGASAEIKNHILIWSLDMTKNIG